MERPFISWSVEVDSTSLSNLGKLDSFHVRPRDIRSLGPVSAKHHRRAPLRVVAGGIIVAANLLARRHVEGIVEGERGQPGVLGHPEVVQRREHRCAQALAEPERAARGLRELRPLDRSVVILVLELSVLAQLRERGAQRRGHHPVGGGLYEIAWHWITPPSVRATACWPTAGCARSWNTVPPSPGRSRT